MSSRTSSLPITGSGVLLVCRKKTLGPCLILIHDYNGKWSDTGGKVEAKYTPRKNASVELKEETRGLFDVPETFLQAYVDLPLTRCAYRSYLLEVTDQSWCTAYNKIDTSSMPLAYQETKGMRYFPLSSVISNMSSSFWLSDVNGRSVSVQVHGRVQSIVQHMYQSGMFDIYLPSHQVSTTTTNTAATSSTTSTSAAASASAGAGVQQRTCGLSGCSRTCNGSFNYCSRIHGQVALRLQRRCLNNCSRPCSVQIDKKTGQTIVYAFCSITCCKASGIKASVLKY